MDPTLQRIKCNHCGCNWPLDELHSSIIWETDLSTETIETGWFNQGKGDQYLLPEIRKSLEKQGWIFGENVHEIKHCYLCSDTVIKSSFKDTVDVLEDEDEDDEDDEEETISETPLGEQIDGGQEIEL